MIRLLIALAVVFSAAAASADDLLRVPSYDGALLWQASVDRLLAQIAEDIRSLIVPAEGRISSRFGMRFHPIFQKSKHHNGIDVACRVGSPVRAVLSGVVSRAGKWGGYGKLIEVRHPHEDMKTRYGHLSRSLVREGARVKRGDVIGYSGNTGVSTAPHLHFELWHQSRVVDPLRYIGKRRSVISLGINRWDRRSHFIQQGA